MKLYEFSEDTVKQAEAALLLGFDVVSRVAVSDRRPNIKKSFIRLENVIDNVRLDSSLFPEIEIGERISLQYIKNFEECNRAYEHPRE